MSEAWTIEVTGGDTGRYATMRTVWREDAPGLFIALDDNGSPQADPITGARVEVFIDGDGWALRMFTRGPGRFIGNDRDAALRSATRQLHD